MAGTKLSGRQIMQLFYTKVSQVLSTKNKDGESEVSTVFRCKCGKTRAQKLKHGYTNLVQHVVVKHSDWIMATMRENYPSSVPAMVNCIKSSTIVNKKQTRAQGDDVLTTDDKEETKENAIVSELKDEEVESITQATMTVKTLPKVQKRSDYLSWDDYFMSVAFLSAMRSKDPSTQVGACIVNSERKIVGIGYNGFPNRCGDDELPWARESETNSPLDTKYPYVCHAEMNAILNKNSTDVKGCTMYVALFPCNECAKLIIQSGISRIVYCSDKYKQDWKFVASRRLLDMAGVQYTQHQLQRSKVVIDFTSVR
ncbi:unnamed protein product [Peronospora farinosa]|uniref:dCMP deaminase n=1 Tax=Peronospora farinosa TaxID=134698 RepID=A0AAV0TYB6_9STRA|nr:unnamed protein product [Peronospora farinosa]CAI5729373.1 unnamed protein product [Peronospora farinosa]